MSTDPIRSSSSPIQYIPYSSPEALPSSSAAPSTTAAPAEVAQNNAYDQSGFDAGAPQSARTETAASTFESAIVQTPPAPPPAPAPTPEQARTAQLEALKTQMSLQEKKDFLKQFGVSDKDLRKGKTRDIENAFNQIIDQMKKPGDAKLTFKIHGKKYEAKIHLDPVKGELDINIKRKKSFMGKLWDTVKKVGKIALTVASFIPGPIGVAARIANAVISAIGAFAKGDFLGGLAAAAGAIVGGAGALAGKAVSGVAKTVVTIAKVVEKGALAAKGVAEGIKNKNWGSVLTAVASGASGVAGALGDSAKKLASTMTEVSKWATRGNTALQAAAAAKNGDIIGALNAGSELVSGIAPKSQMAATFQRFASGASMAQNAYDAAKHGDVLGALSAGAGFAAGQVKAGSKDQKRLEDVSAYAAAANKAKHGDVLGAISDGASQAASRQGEGTRARTQLSNVASYAQKANVVQQAIQVHDYMGAAQILAKLAADEVKDPAAKRKLQKASEVFQGANVVEDAIQSKDYLGAAASAAALAGKLTGSHETLDAAKLLSSASDVRTAVKSQDLGQVLSALDRLRKTVKDVSHQTTQHALSADIVVPAPGVVNDFQQQARQRAFIA